MSGKIEMIEEDRQASLKMLDKEQKIEDVENLLNKKNRRLTEYCASLPLTDETTCGLGICRGRLLQRFANKKAFVILYGILGCIFSACYAYFNGTITTIEKRFRISSKTTGIITVGNDISQLFITILLSYYAGRGHRPRWVAIGVYTVVLFCLMSALPHLLYGPGQDALILTKEFGGLVDSNLTTKLIENESRSKLCRQEAEEKPTCNSEDGSIAPAVILFTAQIISGFGGSLYYTLGVSYMDDNIKKSKTPALISFSYFLRMLGPAIGYSLASVCLKFYISPSLTPTITTADPRWLGAWWLGWLILASFLAIAAGLLALFPKTLPRAAARRHIAQERAKAGLNGETYEPELPASISDLIRTFKRLITNRTLICNNLANVFYFIGFLPYWIFLPKYIETMYKQSASFANFITGTVGLVFSAIGILVSGVVISKYKPAARKLALWNVFVGCISIFGIIFYIFLGCPANDRHLDFHSDGALRTKLPCNENCHCDYVKYSPVCSPEQKTYISPCHAGCQKLKQLRNGTKVYTDCKCVNEKYNFTNLQPFFIKPNNEEDDNIHGSVITGPCAIDCSAKFFMFLAVCCLIKFSGATGRTSNFLVSVRCVEEKDKPVAIALGMTIVSLFAFIPSPIFYGYLIDKTCLVWGKTCTGTGNCWLYNAESLRYILNITSACFVTIGTLFDGGVWFYVKNLKVFDDDDDDDEDVDKKKKSNSR